MNAEDFVTYKQALALKKLGFRERCLHYYEYSEEEPIVYENCYSGDEVLLSDLYYSFNTRNHKRFCDAPTLAQAQAWLRDCKGIDIEPRVWFVGDKREYRPYIMPPKCNDYIAYSPEESYEKALELGISKALELLGKEV